MKNINQILKQELEEIKPSMDTLKEIKKTANDFCDHLQKKLRKKKISAEVFIGGSLAKSTLTRKKKYDVDVFVRFNSKYKDDEISKILGRVIGKNARKIHGSRDYYQLIVHGIIFELIPVIKISKQEDARNITDLSYFHVHYINKKLNLFKKDLRAKHKNRTKSLADEILLAKTFCHAQNCYGAESYIRGFSGYALELLICYYKSFSKFVKEISSISYQNKRRGKIREQTIIDPEKLYKNKQEILMELNEAKLQSPIILIDPTFKQRNALAGLSQQTLDKFKENCKKFLKNPGNEFFEEKDMKNELEKKYKGKLNTLVVKTSKQAGDIAGTKSKRFSEFFVLRLEKEFNIKVKEFDYDEKKNIAYFYFVVDKKKDEVIRGPPVTAVHNLTRFKKAHSKAFIKNHFAYIKIKHVLSLEQWFKLFLKKDKKIIKQMCVKKVGLIS